MAFYTKKYDNKRGNPEKKKLIDGCNFQRWFFHLSITYWLLKKILFLVGNLKIMIVAIRNGVFYELG